VDASALSGTGRELTWELEFFKRPASEQILIIEETAARRGLRPVMVEKDFWVS
jgi:hypothetical protein